MVYIERDASSCEVRHLFLTKSGSEADCEYPLDNWTISMNLLIQTGRYGSFMDVVQNFQTSC